MSNMNILTALAPDYLKKGIHKSDYSYKRILLTFNGYMGSAKTFNIYEHELIENIGSETCPLKN